MKKTMKIFITFHFSSNPLNTHICDHYQLVSNFIKCTTFKKSVQVYSLVFLFISEGGGTAVLSRDRLVCAADDRIRKGVQKENTYICNDATGQNDVSSMWLVVLKLTVYFIFIYIFFLYKLHRTLTLYMKRLWY